MKKRILNAIIFLCVPAVIFFTVVIRREPTYGGKSATMWFQELRLNQDAALNALQHIGAGALPALKDGLKSSALTDRCMAALALGKLLSLIHISEPTRQAEIS